jgi:exosortase/archaeosortase family protein
MSSRSALARDGWATRTEFFAFLLLLAIANGVATRMASALAEGPATALASLLGVNAVIWFALYAIVRIALDERSAQAPRRADWWIAAALIAAALFPMTMASSLALLGVSIHLLRTTAAGTAPRKLGLIGLAATGPLLWGPICLAMFAPEIARLEALIIGAGTGLETQGNLFRSFDGTATFIVTGSCSALANISIAMLLLVTLVQLLDIPMTRRLVPVAAAAVAAMILANTGRLAALGFWPGSYPYLHDGGGRFLLAWGGLILTGIVIGVGLARVARAPA